LGVVSTKFEDFPDCRLDSVDRLDLARTVEGFIRSIGPGMVYTHLPTDLNIDHVRVNEAVVTACRPLPNSTVKRLLCFEIPSSTGWRAGAPAFAPNWFVDVGTTFELKLEALRQYGDEIRPFPHARSIEAITSLARWRGASAGVEMAEAFIVALSIS
jgi:LmbE family N-acetylglucosaminyl deacetylase